MYGYKHTFVLNNNNQDKKHLRKHHELGFVSLRNINLLLTHQEETNSSVFQKEHCGLDTWTRNEEDNRHFLREIEKSFD